VFWQPGLLGWEGALRTRLQQRRAAQLAAAAETAADQSHVLSSSPDDPQLERWLQRQATAEGERLDQLRRRLWEGASWQRHDRVLIVDAHSLLWALDPLEAVPEGEVVITVPDGADQERLTAQLQLLDALRQPRVVVCPPLQPETLSPQLGAGGVGSPRPTSAEPRFEWIAARQPWRGLGPDAVEAWLAALQTLISPKGQWRLLFSTPQIGPAAGLLAVQQGHQGLPASPDDALLAVLGAMAHREARLLAEAQASQTLVSSWLGDRGWNVTQSSWQEPLQLELTPQRISRWLSAGSDYRCQLEAMGHPPLRAAELQLLQHGFEQHLGQAIPQQLHHTLLIARG
jgi:putative ATPase